jgi:beta-galactosidase
MVWVNGFYLGRESSGYSGFTYDLTDLLNYGGENVISVRADASLEEGWFYEGAGIYRHVWLNKTQPLHVAHWGTFVSTEMKDTSADVTARVTVNNDSPNDAAFDIEQTILDADGQPVATGTLKQLSLASGVTGEFFLGPCRCQSASLVLRIALPAQARHHHPPRRRGCRPL